jgi:NTE family protein
MDSPKVAIACQGGGTHAAFEVGVLTEVLTDLAARRFALVGLSGTSAGALCALAAWYGLVGKAGRPGSPDEAIRTLNDFWDGFAATTPAEIMQNSAVQLALRAQQQELPLVGLTLPAFGVTPRGLFSHVLIAAFRQFGVREAYFDFDVLLQTAFPDFDAIDWAAAPTRLLLGASEIVDGVETVFDSDCNAAAAAEKHAPTSIENRWRRRLPLSLRGAAASGTLPGVREAEEIDGGYYWDGLYSQNPPVREFFSGVRKEAVPDEIWVIRINPQQSPAVPVSNAEIVDRENELMGNLSLNKELDFLLIVNSMIERFKDGVAQSYKPVTVRTIKMTKDTAFALRVASKYDRSRTFIDTLRAEGRAVGRAWLDAWPNVGHYPDDAAYDG